MTHYLALSEALHVIAAATGGPAAVRDLGLLESALARPATQLFGQAAYESLALKAAALMESVVQNHALLDGNKRAGLAITAVFLHINGCPLALSQDEAYRLVMDVAEGRTDGPAVIAGRLRIGTASRLE